MNFVARQKVELLS